MAALHRAPFLWARNPMREPVPAASALSVRLFRVLWSWQGQLASCHWFALMASLLQLGHGIFRSGQPEVHLSRFGESGALGMTAEKSRAVRMVLSRCDGAHYKV